MNSFYQNSFFRKKKVLVIVPHMDDEINVAGSMIHSLAGMGCDITVLYTTNGDDAGKGAERIAEAEYALRVLAGFDVEIRVLNYKSQARVGRKHILFSKRNEVVKELIRFIGEHRPEIIFCCDMDAHPDHLCTSLFFEEALGRVLGKKGDYSPFVYKGFAYETAYFATNDFFSRGGGRAIRDLFYEAEAAFLQRWQGHQQSSLFVEGQSSFSGQGGVYCGRRGHAAECDLECIVHA